jgi:hypothetical protein
MAMRLTHAVMVLADISGYTDFITNREVSLLHAEQIITDLLESMIDRTEHPLILNKLEGDAAFLYAESGDDRAAAVRDVLLQTSALFSAFEARLARIRDERANCGCDACANVSNLRLKAFVHGGEIAVKQVRQFEELAGEDVILIHRLMKNHVVGREYVLLTETITGLWPPASTLGQTHSEEFEGMGVLNLRCLAPVELPRV